MCLEHRMLYLQLEFVLRQPRPAAAARYLQLTRCVRRGLFSSARISIRKLSELKDDAVKDMMRNVFHLTEAQVISTRGCLCCCLQ
jgi:hypothetical protein